MHEFWSIILSIESALTRGDRAKAILTDRPRLKQFLDHCCVVRHYHFSIKKCGSLQCSICKPPRLSSDVFSTVCHLPDPVPDADGEHYKSFDDLYSTATTERYRPSLQSDSRKGHLMPFSPCAQQARNVAECILCSECLRPRVLYAQHKLRYQELTTLKAVLQDYFYTCGSVLQDAITDPESPTGLVLAKVFVRANLTCQDHIEVPFYSSEVFLDICVHCGCSTTFVDNPDIYPTCSFCYKTETKVFKRKRRKFQPKK